MEESERIESVPIRKLDKQPAGPDFFFFFFATTVACGSWRTKDETHTTAVTQTFTMIMLDP